MATTALLERGAAALRACDWAAARSCFAEAVAREETAEAVDGLGQALYWSGEYRQAITLRERAYALYRALGAHAEAAVTAVQIAMLHGLVNGNGAAVSGWLGHARRAVAEAPDGVERGWVVLFEAAIASDPGTRERLAAAAHAVGRRWHQPALEYDALGYVGMARVQRDAVSDGMRLVDEAVAAVTCGLVADPWATAEILCTLYSACEIAIDVGRAEEWLTLVDHHVRRTGELPVFGVCRSHYGGLLTAAGRWQQAERELRRALACYEAGYRGALHEPQLRLADLCARQGRLAEATALLEGHQRLHAAFLPRARIHLADGEPDLAAVLARRHLDRGRAGVATAPAMMLLVQALVADRRVDEAAPVADELTALADRCVHPPVLGFAAFSQGRVAAAGGALERARACLEEAIRWFAAAGLDDDLAAARLELAAVVLETDPHVARAEAQEALSSAQRRRAGSQAEAAGRLLHRLDARTDHRRSAAGGLSRREREVHELLAEGLTNAEIAARLFISPRTAEHHVGNILRKLGVRNRAEAAARLARRATISAVG